MNHKFLLGCFLLSGLTAHAQNLIFTNPTPITQEVFNNPMLVAGNQVYFQSDAYKKGVYVTIIDPAHQKIETQINIKADNPVALVLAHTSGQLFKKNGAIYKIPQAFPMGAESDVEFNIYKFDPDFTRLEVSDFAKYEGRKAVKGSSPQQAVSADKTLLATRYGDDLRIYNIEKMSLMKQVTLPSAVAGMGLTITASHDVLLCGENSLWFISESSSKLREIPLELPAADYLEASVHPGSDPDKLLILMHFSNLKEVSKTSFNYDRNTNLGAKGMCLISLDLKSGKTKTDMYYFGDALIKEGLVEVAAIWERSPGQYTLVVNTLHYTIPDGGGFALAKKDYVAFLNIDNGTVTARKTVKTHSGDKHSTGKESEIFLHHWKDKIILLYQDRYDDVLKKTVLESESLEQIGADEAHSVKGLSYFLGQPVQVAQNEYHFVGGWPKKKSLGLLTLKLE